MEGRSPVGPAPVRVPDGRPRAPRRAVAAGMLGGAAGWVATGSAAGQHTAGSWDGHCRVRRVEGNPEENLQRERPCCGRVVWGPGSRHSGPATALQRDRPPARPPEPGSGTTRVSLCLRVFKQCHGVIPPQPYYQGCVFDHCHVNDPQVVCSGLELYATLCASHGTCVDWRGWTNHTCRECRPPGAPPPSPAPLPGRQTAGGLPGGGGLTSGRV